MLILQIALFSIITSLAYTVMIQPSELLQRWSRFWNSKFPDTVFQKLFTCGYCFSGQLSFWTSFILSDDIKTLISVPISIFTTWLIIKELKKAGNL